ncbi:hypothetical protein [Idiomarina aminovorans]|uniref:hypothetical protein n=1 Tax=Idiomarina aminovorans TaxID=2914829 RepID=UPI002005E59C|nr:hypothetical protein [Idiomarina sp. ATCH4]MCK7458009.1 hypothetical protein [Idiomarina sp. ATCH4]
MPFKIYQLIIATFGLFFVNSVNAEFDTLPDCGKKVCSEIFHNEKLDQATLVVWEGEGNIIRSQVLELDDSAVLTNQSNFTSVDNSNDLLGEEPPAPCESGSCSSVRILSYESTGEIITVIMTFFYYNEQLIDVHLSEKRTVKPVE